MATRPEPRTPSRVFTNEDLERLQSSAGHNKSLEDGWLVTVRELIAMGASQQRIAEAASSVAYDAVWSANRVNPNFAYREVARSLQKSKKNYYPYRFVEDRAGFTSTDWKPCLAGGEVDIDGRRVKVGAAAAFVRNQEMFLCKFSGFEQLRTLPYVLIHEAAHVAGIYNECDAIKIEYSIVVDAGLALSESVIYSQLCEVRPGYRLSPADVARLTQHLERNALAK